MKTEERKAKKRWELIGQILELSEATDWLHATQEWEVAYQWEDEERSSECLCTQPHLRYVNVLTNRLNGSEVQVGSICVELFGSADMRKIVRSINRIRHTPSSVVSVNTLAWFLSKKLLSEDEAQWYADHRRIKKYQTELMNTRIELNTRLVSSLDAIRKEASKAA